MSIPMAGHFRAIKPFGSQVFPDKPQFSGFMKPCRFEGEIQNLEVQGEIPDCIDGTFYRVMPDPQLPPFIENDPVSLQYLGSMLLSENSSGSMAMATSVLSAYSPAKFTSSSDTLEQKNSQESVQRNAL